MQKSYTRTIVLIVCALLVGVGIFLVVRQGSSSIPSGPSSDESQENPDTELEATVEAHFQKGQEYNRAGQLLEAASEFRTVIALDPENAAAHHNLGVTHIQLQDLSSAISEFEIAVELEPKDPDTRYQLGASYLYLALAGAESGDSEQFLEQAQNEFETALELEEDMPQALIGLGNIYNQQGDYAAAIQMLKRAIEKAPDLPEAYYALGEAYARSNDVANACETYSQFAKMNSPSVWQDQARQVMTALGCP